MTLCHGVGLVIYSYGGGMVVVVVVVVVGNGLLCGTRDC